MRQRIIAIIKTVIDATHEVQVLGFYWWTGDLGNEHEFAPLVVGWGSLMVGVYNGRPLIGVQVYSRNLCVWVGPFFWALGKT